MRHSAGFAALSLIGEVNKALKRQSSGSLAEPDVPEDDEKEEIEKESHQSTVENSRATSATSSIRPDTSHRAKFVQSSTSTDQ